MCLSVICPLAERARMSRKGTLVGVLPDMGIMACHSPVKPQCRVDDLAVKGISEILDKLPWLLALCQL